MARGGNKPSTAAKKAASSNKKPANGTPDSQAKLPEHHSIPLQLQQKCLDIFRDALRPTDDDNKVLQEVKGHLYGRDFATAFGREDYLRVYASRWSPSRALAYVKIFADLAPQIGEDVATRRGPATRTVCLGGGAGGELVALGACLSTRSDESSLDGVQACHADLVDIADWTSVVQQIHAGLTTPPELSKYASQAKKDANKALIDSSALDVEFHRLDVLSSDATNQDLLASLVQEADLVTFMFTLNELYSSSLPATQSLLTRVTETMKAGSHLLVVDSPGSYSTVSLNGAEKKYPMQWLLDHTLLGSEARIGEGKGKWEKVVEDQSRWFRLSKELRYPIVLEDMRFQVHLFRRLE